VDADMFCKLPEWLLEFFEQLLRVFWVVCLLACLFLVYRVFWAVSGVF